ncbi:MAG: HNH endonuclease signature motif containing protein [Halioglobus sp.]
MDIGRRTRSIPPAIRRALQRRDGGCRFPGCTARHHVDAHHIRHWADGGETRLDNLLLLCRHHHRLVHEGGYGIVLDAAKQPVFTAPNGGQIATGPDTRFRGNVFALTTGNGRARVEIGARTGVPYWCGDRMDDGMAVEGLVRRE